jgi:clan AA aspartic protease
MISGTVNGEREAIIELTVRSPGGRAAAIAAIVDTGFDGALTLPLSSVDALRLPLRKRGTATLGDGSETSFAFHRATVLWDGEARQISVAALESEPLVGMELLAGYRLTVQVIPGGRVEIVSLATPR